jgi:hypothetical protein
MDTGKMQMRMKLLGLRVPKDWEMEGNKGTSYKVTVAWETPNGFESVALKVDADTYQTFKSQGVAFGTELLVTFAPRVLIRDNQPQLVVAAVAFEPVVEHSRKAAS